MVVRNFIEMTLLSVRTSKRNVWANGNLERIHNNEKKNKEKDSISTLFSVGQVELI